MSRKFLGRILPVLGGLLVCASASAADLTWNGFGSAYYGQAFSSNLTPFGFSSPSSASVPNNRPDFTDFSLFGLNVNAKLDDHWSAGAQLVALGDRTAASNTTFATFNVQAAWAYVSYKSDDGTQVRAGRQRFPIFTASEYIYEHAELPFREMPAIVFQMAPFVAFDGFSVSHGFDVGPGKINIQAFGGTPILAVTPSTNIPAQLSNLIGARINYEGDGWRVRGVAARSSSVSGVDEADSEYFAGGYRFDKYNIVSWGEYIYRHAPDGTVTPLGTYVGTGKAGYVLGGYRIGQWLPRYTFAQATAALGPVGNGKTTTHTIGVNYQFNEKVVLKAEYELTLIPTALGGYKTAQPVWATSTSGSAVYAGVDFMM